MTKRTITEHPCKSKTSIYSEGAPWSLLVLDPHPALSREQIYITVPPSPSNFLQKAIYLVAVRLKVVLELKLELNIIFLEFYTRPVRRLRVLVVPRAEAKTEAEAEAVVEVLLIRE